MPHKVGEEAQFIGKGGMGSDAEEPEQPERNDPGKPPNFTGGNVERVDFSHGKLCKVQGCGRTSSAVPCALFLVLSPCRIWANYSCVVERNEPQPLFGTVAVWAAIQDQSFPT